MKLTKKRFLGKMCEMGFNSWNGKDKEHGKDR